MTPYSTSSRNHFVASFIIFCSLTFSLFANAQAAKPATTALKVTLQEAVLFRSLLDQAQISTEDIDHFLALYTPLDKAITSQSPQASIKKTITLALEPQLCQYAIFFMASTQINSQGADVAYSLFNKVRARLPKDVALPDPFKSAPKEKTIAITTQEAKILLTLLANVQLQVAELPGFMALRAPLNAIATQTKGNKKHSVKYAKITIEQLQELAPRFFVQGKQARTIKSLLARFK